jgi:multiple sugar transport system substrate-binding protein
MAELSRRFASARPEVAFEWRERPLSTFEHQDIAEVAGACDLVLIDHPFMGDLVGSGAFQPLSGLGIGCDRSDASGFVGPSLPSYRFGGATWAVPVDGAAQHAAFRPDLIGEVPPTNWDEALSLGRTLRRRGLWVGFAALTPHAGLALGALMANLGTPWEADADSPFAIDREGFAAAYAMMAELVALCPPEIFRWNAIDLHEAMTARDDIGYCPCVFGYATYAEPGPRRLAFAGFPGPRAPHSAGGVLGGAGLAVPRGAQAAAIDFAAFCATAEAQRGLALHHGQAARHEEWEDPASDQRLGGYFGGVRATLEAAWVRPRLRGYPAFQERLGRLVAEGLESRRPAATLWPEAAALAARVNP